MKVYLSIYLKNWFSVNKSYLFQDLLNFDDPLNIEAAEMYRTHKDKFKKKVREYVELYARDDNSI